MTDKEETKLLIKQLEAKLPLGVRVRAEALVPDIVSILNAGFPAEEAHTQIYLRLLTAMLDAQMHAQDAGSRSRKN